MSQNQNHQSFQALGGQNYHNYHNSYDYGVNYDAVSIDAQSGFEYY